MMRELLQVVILSQLQLPCSSLIQVVRNQQGCITFTRNFTEYATRLCTADGTWEFNIKLNRSLGDYNKCAEKSLRLLKMSDEIYDDADILIHGDEDINPTTLVSLSLSHVLLYRAADCEVMTVTMRLQSHMLLQFLQV